MSVIVAAIAACVIAAPPQLEAASAQPLAELSAPLDPFEIAPDIREPTEAEWAEIERLVGAAEAARDANRFDEAFREANALVELARATFGPAHPVTASSINIVGQVHYAKGEYREAAALFAEVAEMRVAALGEAHPDVGQAYNNLASAHVMLGDYRAGLEGQRKALAVWRAALGPDHPEVAAGVENLGMALIDTGDLAEADAVLTEADALLRRVAPEDMGRARVLSALGRVATGQGRYERAETCYREAFAFAQSVGEERSVSASIALTGVGDVLDTVGRHAEAIPYFQQGADIFELTLGAEHPFVGTSLANMGAAHVVGGDFGRAEPLLRRALTLREGALGADHVETAEARSYLGEALRGQGRLLEAQAEAERAVTDLAKALGDQHRLTAFAVMRLATTLGDAGEPNAAVAMGSRAVDALRAELGPDHPDTASAEARLASLLLQSGDAQGAEAMFRRALVAADHAYGAAGDIALDRRAGLMEALLRLNRPRDALEAGRAIDTLNARRPGGAARRVYRSRINAAWVTASALEAEAGP